MKTLSLIVPCYNEETNIAEFYNTFLKVYNKSLSKLINYEIVFIDDGSKDKTVEEVNKVIAKDDKVTLVEFSRNFGKEIALTAGLSNCKGDGCVFLDSDLQYPIDKLPDFVDKWLSGVEVVIGMRDSKKTNNIVEKVGSLFFYKIIQAISDTPIISGALDYRLLDRVVIDELLKFSERGRMVRALIDWLGFRRDFVYYKELPRFSGEPGYSFVKRLKLALSTFISQSLFPLKLAGYIGLFIFSLSGVLGVFILIQSYILKDPMKLNISNSFSLGVLNSFLVGIVLMSLGIIALYIANIHTEVTNRPIYVVRKIHQKITEKNSKAKS